MCKSTRRRQREHIAVDEIQIAAFLCRDPILILQLANVVGAHPAVLTGNGIAIHSALVITTQQSFQIELHEVFLLLTLQQE